MTPHALSMRRGCAEEEEVPDLLLPQSAQEESERLLLAAHPKEACALLLGARTIAGHEVSRLAPVLNLAADADEFHLDPLDWHKVESEARTDGLEVLGVWHSHPRTAAASSPRDRAGAQPGWSHAISAAAEPTRIRSYYFSAGRLMEQRVLTKAPVA